MLEWLKAILGDGYNEEIDKQISAEIGKGFVAKADFNAAKEAQRGTAEQLAAANKELEEYKGMDIEGLRKSAADWQAKAEQAEKDADARVAAFQFDAKLDHAIIAARGRNGKAIRALLDLDALRTSKDPDKDIAAALTAVQKDNGYMFDTAPTPPPRLPRRTPPLPLKPQHCKRAFSKRGSQRQVHIHTLLYYTIKRSVSHELRS